MDGNQKMKKCSKCNIEKELSEFYRRKDSKDGYRNECKICKNEISKKYSIENYEKVFNIKKKYYLLNLSEGESATEALARVLSYGMKEVEKTPEELAGEAPEVSPEEMPAP